MSLLGKKSVPEPASEASGSTGLGLGVAWRGLWLARCWEGESLVKLSIFPS